MCFQNILLIKVVPDILSVKGHIAVQTPSCHKIKCTAQYKNQKKPIKLFIIKLILIMMQTFLVTNHRKLVCNRIGGVVKRLEMSTEKCLSDQILICVCNINLTLFLTRLKK